MKKIYAIIALTIILLVINICLTLYINNDDQYYEANYLSHYYKLKNMPTIIPIEYEEPEYEYDDDDVEEYYFQNMEDIENNLLINNNIKFNDSNNKFFNFCYLLLNEFLFCLSPENDKNYRCKKLFYEKLNELEKCDIIKFNKSKNSKKEIIFFNFPKEEYIDVEDEFEKEKKYKEKSEFSLKKDEENEDEEKSKKQILLYNPKNNIKNENANKDCVEYGLTKDDYIICTKYE